MSAGLPVCRKYLKKCVFFTEQKVQETYLCFLVKKDNFLGANAQKLLRNSALLEPPSTRHTHAEERTVIARVALATLNVAMFRVAIG